MASGCVRLDAQPIVHGVPELLLAAKVALGRLDGDVPEQELDLVQFATGQVAQTGARAPKVVRRQLLDVGALRGGAHHIPQHLGGQAVAPDATVLG